LITHKLGDVLEAAENQPQVVIEAFSWMAAELAQSGDYVLVTCCVAPGWEPTDYEFADLNEMCAKYPKHTELFKRLIRVKANSSKTDMDYQSPPI
jgi:predicted cupin superfamily sugar epimerase